MSGRSSWGWRSSSASTAGASSRMTCAFVPLTPNEDTPALRGRSVRGHGTGSDRIDTAPAVQSTCGDGSLACSVFGSSPFRRASTILITPATPAPAWQCAMFDFTEPSQSGLSGEWACP